MQLAVLIDSEFLSTKLWARSKVRKRERGIKGDCNNCRGFMAKIIPHFWTTAKNKNATQILPPLQNWISSKVYTTIQ